MYICKTSNRCHSEVAAATEESVFFQDEGKVKFFPPGRLGLEIRMFLLLCSR